MGFAPASLRLTLTSSVAEANFALVKRVVQLEAVRVHFQEQVQVVTVTLPTGISGNYFILPWTDTFDVVFESTLDVNANPDDPNELDGNNYKARPILVLGGGQPDLAVTSIEMNERWVSRAHRCTTRTDGT